MTGYSLSYILDSLSLDFVMMLYSHGLKFEETKATIFVNKIAEGLFGTKGKKSKSKIGVDKPPPKYAELKRMFGDKVKRKVKEN